MHQLTTKYRFEHANHDILLISKSLQTLFACALSAPVILPYLSEYKNLIFRVMISLNFYQSSIYS